MKNRSIILGSILVVLVILGICWGVSKIGGLINGPSNATFAMGMTDTKRSIDTALSQPTYTPFAASIPSVCDYGRYVYPFARVTVTGYIYHGSSVRLSNGGNNYFDIYLLKSLTGSNPLAEKITLTLLIGDEPNHIAELPDPFTEADFKVYTDDNQVAHAGDLVEITGSIYGPESCQIMAEKILKK